MTNEERDPETGEFHDVDVTLILSMHPEFFQKFIDAIRLYTERRDEGFVELNSLAIQLVNQMHLEVTQVATVMTESIATIVENQANPTVIQAELSKAWRYWMTVHQKNLESAWISRPATEEEFEQFERAIFEDSFIAASGRLTGYMAACTEITDGHIEEATRRIAQEEGLRIFGHINAFKAALLDMPVKPIEAKKNYLEKIWELYKQ